MWKTLKNALIGVTDEVGIEVPGLPIDLGPLGDSATTAAQDLTASTTGAIDRATGAAETFIGLPLDDILPK